MSEMTPEAVLDLGWGRLIFGQTFDDTERLGQLLRDEQSGRRDICFYREDAHILVAQYPQHFFIDPSYTYRLDLTDRDAPGNSPLPERTDLVLRQASSVEDIAAMNALYVRTSMVPADPDVMWQNVNDDKVLYLVAEDPDEEIVGTATGVDHVPVLGGDSSGSSMWSVAAHPSAPQRGVGEMIVREMARIFRDRGRTFLDLSVVHSNVAAISLYEKLGFVRVPVMGLKRKNAINEPLFAAAPDDDLHQLNPYARIIADEALRRGIRTRVLDASTGYLELQHGGRTVITRESLSQYTSAIAMSRCDDKRLARRVVEQAGIRVAQGRSATFDEEDVAFLHEMGTVVVKPARGEQGAGITLNIQTEEQLNAALAYAGGYGTEILIEEHVAGDDLRVVVIDGTVVAAAVRRPPVVVGDGETTVRKLVETLSRRRSRATGGESKIPVDSTTAATVQEEGYGLDDVLPAGERLLVRRTANLHTGGTMEDVTDILHPKLAEVAITAAEAIGIPVTGIDLLVPHVHGPDYVFIEANERPGLANHEPQPVVQAFIDFLFPSTRSVPLAWGT